MGKFKTTRRAFINGMAAVGATIVASGCKKEKPAEDVTNNLSPEEVANNLSPEEVAIQIAQRELERQNDLEEINSLIDDLKVCRETLNNPDLYGNDIDFSQLEDMDIAAFNALKRSLEFKLKYAEKLGISFINLDDEGAFYMEGLQHSDGIASKIKVKCINSQNEEMTILICDGFNTSIASADLVLSITTDTPEPLRAFNLVQKSTFQIDDDIGDTSLRPYEENINGIKLARKDVLRYLNTVISFWESDFQLSDIKDVSVTGVSRPCSYLTNVPKENYIAIGEEAPDR